ncbi:hypothetical protein ACFFMR_04585 [Micromonospora andamanensis]|uniref:Uncharacterized protein n=1 Tax=Micromonospora andamanensis TaxID=1287068 RepID=A0ABQ4I4N7_9ACTN|nr:hypothetical protein [Micromonospora andamanensis]GIJ12848.1 hypothetical protein Van01_60620 [Micromonospora andamanensis]
MPNVQQPEMRRSGETRLVQDSDGPIEGGSSSTRREHRSVPVDQVSPYGPDRGRASTSHEPTGRESVGD